MILRHSTYANVKYYKTTITILILLFSIIIAKERECKDGKLSLLSPIQGDIIQSKNNEFNIQWNVRDDDNSNKHREIKYFLKLSLESTSSVDKLRKGERRQSIIYDYINNKNAWVTYTIYGTYKLELQLISLSTNEIIDTQTRIFSVLPGPDAFRKKPYDTYNKEDFDLFEKTCPSLLLSQQKNNDKQAESGNHEAKTITYLGNLKMDGQRIIWLEQMSNINTNNNHDHHEYFKFQYLNFWGNTDSVNGKYLEKALNQRNVPLLNVRINIDNVNKHWQLNETYTTNLLLMYSDFKRKHVNEQTIENHIAPASKLNWLNEVWKNITTVFTTTDIAVFPNPDDISTKIYIRAARYAGVKRIVVEMSHWNFETLQDEDIDLVIAPSIFTYTLVKKYMMLKKQQSFELCHISPSVGDMINYYNNNIDESPTSSLVEKQFNTHAAYEKDKGKLVTIGVVSRLAYGKNIGLFITIASVLKLQYNIKAKYVIIGNGPAMNDLKYLAKQLDVIDDINFLGFVDNKELPLHLSKFDIFLNPTVLTETLCISNVEAMALGIPVVALGLESGSMEYLDDIASVGIDLSTPLSSSSSNSSSSIIIMDKIMNIMLHLIQNKQKRKRIGQRGRARVKRDYLKHNTMEKYEKIFRGCLLSSS